MIGRQKGLRWSYSEANRLFTQIFRLNAILAISEQKTWGLLLFLFVLLRVVLLIRG